MQLSKRKLTYGKLAAKFGELPIVGVNVSFTPSQDDRFNSEVGTGNWIAPYQDSGKGLGVLQAPSRNQLVTGKGGSKTESPLEGVLSNSTSTEHSGISLIPLSIILDLLTGPAAMQSSGGGGTSNDLDWNDERRRRQKAQENQYVNRPFKRRR